MTALADLLDTIPPWTEGALCAQVDTDSFFPEKGGSTREAKKVCMGCEVREECLRYALDNDERFGIWGGLSERERRKLKKTTPAMAPTTTDQPATEPEEEPAMPTCRKCHEQVRSLVADTDLCISCDSKLDDNVRPAPSYAHQIIEVMAASEGHSDPAVRAARKTVANALVALNKTLRGENPTPLTAVPPLPSAKKKSWARVNNSGRIAERIAKLGVTSRDIREWAYAQRFADVPSRGAIPARLVDAYEAAHPEAS